MFFHACGHSVALYSCQFLPLRLLMHSPETHVSSWNRTALSGQGCEHRLGAQGDLSLPHAMGTSGPVLPLPVCTYLNSQLRLSQPAVSSAHHLTSRNHSAKSALLTADLFCHHKIPALMSSVLLHSCQGCKSGRDLPQFSVRTSGSSPNSSQSFIKLYSAI